MPATRFRRRTTSHARNLSRRSHGSRRRAGWNAGARKWGGTRARGRSRPGNGRAARRSERCSPAAAPAATTGRRSSPDRGSANPRRLKCLRAHAAYGLANPGYLLGERVLAEVDRCGLPSIAAHKRIDPRSPPRTNPLNSRIELVPVSEAEIDSARRDWEDGYRRLAEQTRESPAGERLHVRSRRCSPSFAVASAACSPSGSSRPRTPKPTAGAARLLPRTRLRPAGRKRCRSSRRRRSISTRVGHRTTNHETLRCNLSRSRVPRASLAVPA